MYGIQRMWYSRHLVFGHESLSCTSRANWTIIHRNGQWFRMPFDISRNEFFAKRSQHVCINMTAVHFDATCEFINNVEVWRIPHYRKRKPFGPNISPHNCWDIISGETPHLVRRLVQEKSGLVPCDERLPSIRGGHFELTDHLSSNLLPLEPESVSQKMWNSS
jgi:hypothetical protein